MDRNTKLAIVPYLDTSALDDRTVKLMPFWDGDNWHWWIDLATHLLPIKIVDTSEVDYVAKTPAKSTDVLIPFVHIMWQQASWKEICPQIIAISEDFHNMGTSIAKLRHIHEFRAKIGSKGSHRFALTELEYLVTLCRTTFDLLQEMIATIWKIKIRLIDETAEQFRLSHSLPKTFSKMVLDEKETPRTAAQIKSRFGLPDALAEQYEQAAPFFSKLRQIRDRIIHGGSGFGLIFDTERGFCVDPKSKPFDEFGHWLPEHYYNENIVSVLPWIANTINGTIGTCNNLVRALASCIKLPPPLAPGYAIFIRGYHNDALVGLLSVLDGGSVWWDSSTTQAQVDGSAV